MVIGLLRIFAILCVALTCGKLISKLKLPAILGWLIAGIVFGPYLAEVVTLEITGSVWYKVIIKLFECFAGVMIGREIVFKKIAKSGKQIIGSAFGFLTAILMNTKGRCEMKENNDLLKMSSWKMIEILSLTNNF